MPKAERTIRKFGSGRSKRQKLSPTESLKRMQNFADRKAEFVARIRRRMRSQDAE